MTRGEADDYRVCGKIVGLPAESMLTEASPFEAVAQNIADDDCVRRVVSIR